MLTPTPSCPQQRSVPNLTSLSVKHAAFLRCPPSVVQFSRVLGNSPSLVVPFSPSPTLFFSSSQLTSPRHPGMQEPHARGARPIFRPARSPARRVLPALQALALDILVPEAPSGAPALATLLQGTPALQRAAWSHLFPEALSAGALLALHTLHAEGVPARRGGAALDALGSVCVEALRHLEVASFESFAVIVRAVRLFPRLRWLRMPAVDYWHEHLPVTSAPVHLVRPANICVYPCALTGGCGVGRMGRGACGAARARGLPRRVDLPRS